MLLRGDEPHPRGASAGQEGGRIGGAGRDRTGDLVNAIHARSQLRYSPTEGRKDIRLGDGGQTHLEPSSSKRSVDWTWTKLEWAQTKRDWTQTKRTQTRRTQTGKK